MTTKNCSLFSFNLNGKSLILGITHTRKIRIQNALSQIRNRTLLGTSLIKQNTVGLFITPRGQNKNSKAKSKSHNKFGFFYNCV